MKKPTRKRVNVGLGLHLFYVSKKVTDKSSLEINNRTKSLALFAGGDAWNSEMEYRVDGTMETCVERS